MRNLKKILALVLALVMSLSLMATAGAAETTAAESGSKYQTATDVLQGLEVIRGDEGGFRYQDTITRAEVAAVLYRIATGDVKDTQAGIHTGQPFTDVKANDWYTPYISYCYIAEYIKGNPNGTFEPDTNINGYATLAMILRAMGYGKNGEFEGDGWEIRTASTARQIGILENVFDTQLSGPATRELVAEILFRAMLKDEVKFSALNPYNYESLGTTLGGRNFGLEEVTGVIKANQWANLEGTTVLAADTTKMTVSATNPANSSVAKVGQDIVLDKATDLEAVGLTYTAYVAGKDTSKTVLTDLVESGNTVRDNEGGGVGTGKADQSYTNISKLADGLDLSEALYFVNYDESRNDHAQSKWLIRYAVAQESVTEYDKVHETEWAKFLKDNGATERTISVPKQDGTGDTVTVKCWLRSIRPGSEIKSTDLDIMEEIFYTADRIGYLTSNDGGALRDYVFGEVYVGTSSMKDISDELNWNDFCDEYLTFDKVLPYSVCEKGNSLRIVDNDGDGKAEYVLKVEYTQSKAVDTYKGELAFLGGLKMSDYTDNNLYNPDELSSADVGVIANYTKIDKKLSIWKAEVVTDIINAKSYKDITVTTAEGGETLGQSYIQNDTGLDENIMNLPEKVTYNLYLDAYRNIRSFELAGEKQYALVTEVYYNGSQNWNYVKTNDFVVEAVLNGEETGPVAVDEYPGSTPGVFFSSDSTGAGYAWTSRSTRYYGNNNDLNYLQPATAHLGVEDNVFAGYTDGTAPLYKNNLWNRNVFAAHDFDATPAFNIHVFDYGDVAYAANGTANAPYEHVSGGAGNSNTSFSFTNVAKYVENDGALTLSTASEVYHNQNGEKVYRATKNLTVGGETIKQYDTRTEAQWKELYATDVAFNAAVAAQDIYLVYATDYVQLRLGANMMTNDGRHFTIANNYGTKYNALSNTYVDTLKETQFYVVTPDKVYRQVGFSSFVTFMKSINVDVNGSEVRAAYAVAQNTRKDANGQDYWVADVVVLEVNTIGHTYDSIALMYYNPDEATGNTQNVNSLDSEWRTLQPEYENKAMMTISPKNTRWSNTSWGNSQYGFYGMIDQELVAEGDMTAANIERITYGNYNACGIYAGVLRRNAEIQNSDYIDVEVVGRTYNPAGGTTHYTVKYDEWNTPIYRVVKNTHDTSVEEMYLTNFEPTNTVYDGDRVIVVLNAAGETSFVVDLGPNDNSIVGIKAVDYSIPTWLDQQWWMVAIEQVFTNGSAAAADVANATIGNLTAAVNALNAAVKADQNLTTLAAANPYAAKLAWILLENGKGYDYRFNADTTLKDLDDLTVENIDDLVAGLTAASYTLGGDWKTAVNNAISSESLTSAIIAARARINAIKDAAVEAGDDDTVALADAALDALKDPAVDTPDEAKAIADDLEAEVNGTDTPVTPTGKYKVEVLVNGEAVTGLTATPATADSTVPAVITITAPAGKSLPSAGTNVAVTVNGAVISSSAANGYTYNRVTGDQGKATITFKAANMANEGNISINITEALGTPTALDIGLTVKNGSNGDSTMTGSGVTVTGVTPIYAGDYLPTLTVTGIPTGMYVGSAAGDVVLSVDGGTSNLSGTGANADYTYNHATNTITFNKNIAAGTGANNTLTLKLYQDVTVSLDGAGAANVEFGTTSAVKGQPLTTLNISAKPGYEIATMQVSDGTTVKTIGSGVTVNTDGTATITGFSSVAANVTVTVTTNRVLTVTATGTGIKLKTPATGKVTYNATLAGTTLEIELDASHPTSLGWALPGTATVTIGETEYAATVDGSGAITVTSGPANITGDITITADAVQKATVGALAGTGAANYDMAVAPAGAQTIGGAMPKLTLTVNATGTAASASLPTKDHIVVTMVDGSTMLTPDFNYNNGEITFADTVKVTGNITVTLS